MTSNAIGEVWDPKTASAFHTVGGALADAALQARGMTCIAAWLASRVALSAALGVSPTILILISLTLSSSCYNNSLHHLANTRVKSR